MNEFIVKITTWVTPPKQSFVLRMKSVSDSSRIWYLPQTMLYTKLSPMRVRTNSRRGSFIRLFFPLYFSVKKANRKSFDVHLENVLEEYEIRIEHAHIVRYSLEPPVNVTLKTKGKLVEHFIHNTLNTT